MFASLQQQKSTSHFSAHRFQAKSNAPFFQRKPIIGPANDSYEQEADRVADAVVGGQKNVVQSKGISSLQRKCSACEEEEAQAKFFTTEPNVQRQVEEEEEEAVQPKFFESSGLQRKGEEEEEALQAKTLDSTESLQRQSEEEEEEEYIQPKNNGHQHANSSFSTLLSTKTGSGQALPGTISQQMGQAMGADFSNVKVHTDDQANSMSQQINAKAFTYGHDIYFNKGQYNPESKEGRHLLAHELTHTIQQNSVQRKIQRELAIEHPNPDAVARQLTPTEIQSAIDFNSRLTSRELTVIRDVLGLNHNQPTNDAQLAQSIAQFQAENNIGVDGKIGRTTAARLTREFSAESRFVGGRRGDRDLFYAARRMGTRSFNISVNRPAVRNNFRGSATYGVMFNLNDTSANGYIIQHVQFGANITNCTGSGVTSVNAAPPNNYWEAWRVVNGQVQCGNMTGPCVNSDDTFQTGTEAANTRGTVSETGRVNFFPDYVLDSTWVTTPGTTHPAWGLPHRASAPPEWSESAAKSHTMTVVYDDCASPKTTTITTNP